MASTKRLVNTGAEEFLGLTTPVLDKGYIKLVDYMGVDETIVAAARHSYGKELDLGDHEGNAKLINFLMRERHTSPFEQPALVFEVKAPIFVFREWIRHRTAKLNEFSGRYAEMIEEFYVPDPSRVQAQSKANKQGSGDVLPQDVIDEFLTLTTEAATQAFKKYKRALELGVSKELARIHLPLSTYSKMVWQCDLHNLLHFLKLRMDEKAQWEIRQYAEATAEVVKASFPKVWAAFDEHVLGAVTLSRTEAARASDILNGYGARLSDAALLKKFK